MNWNEFKTNVQKWASERGIYEHSTPLAQAMKAGSEAGELVDAIIKDDIDAVADAIGDVCVCLVNYAYMQNERIEPLGIDAVWSNFGPEYYASHLFVEVGLLMVCADMGNKNNASESYIMGSMSLMQSLCIKMDLDLMECCEGAWEQIKGRKGFLSAGGAFVKEA